MGGQVIRRRSLRRCRYQGRNAVRIERIDDIPGYDAAFDFLTNFYHDKGYKATTSKRDENDEQHLMIKGNKQRSLQPKLSQDEADTLLDDEIYLASGVSCRYHHLHVKFRANTVFISQQGNPYSS